MVQSGDGSNLDGERGSETTARIPKTAIVLIHGIGEQRPMETLWGFVDAVWSSDPELVDPFNGAVYAKPDTVNDSFELRRVTTRYWKASGDEARRRMDFFEFYWAHLMTGNTVKGTVAWIVGLFLRRPSTVPPGLIHLWIPGVLLIALGAVLFAGNTLVPEFVEQVVGRGPALAISIVLALAGVFAGGILAPYAGDAARYFSPDPDNVDARQKIMRAGVEVIERLTKSGEYDRIILVGHSLGSAIGLDILHNAFGRLTDAQLVRAHANAAASEGLDNLEKMAGKLVEEKAGQQEYAAAQRAYAAALRDGWGTGSAAWLVSDFVTLGSPLSKAGILIAKNDDALKTLKERRQIPTCPPKLEQKQPPRFSYSPASKTRIPHFAAVFGPTVWTNLYFPSKYIVFGDIVSGKVASVFGPGVRDVEIPIGELRFRHTDYWAQPTAELTPPWITGLRQAVNLRMR